MPEQRLAFAAKASIVLKERVKTYVLVGLRFNGLIAVLKLEKKALFF